MAASSDVEVTSDSAGSLGFGAYFRSEWFSGVWAPCQAGCFIAYKELFPIVIAAFIWGPQWSRQHILFRSDNEAVVHIFVTRTSRTVDLMVQQAYQLYIGTPSETLARLSSQLAQLPTRGIHGAQQ